MTPLEEKILKQIEVVEKIRDNSTELDAIFKAHKKDDIVSLVYFTIVLMLMRNKNEYCTQPEISHALKGRAIPNALEILASMNLIKTVRADKVTNPKKIFLTQTL